MEGMEDMDPEMAAALAASMMEAPSHTFNDFGATAPMMTDESNATALAVLENLKSSLDAEIHPLLDACRDSYDGKKWHVVTDDLEKMFASSVWQSNDATRASLVKL